MADVDILFDRLRTLRKRIADLEKAAGKPAV